MDKFQAFGKNLSASFTPFAARTQQYVKEQLGHVEDKVYQTPLPVTALPSPPPPPLTLPPHCIQTQLPPEYLALEKRVDALKQVHQKMLQVTSQYATESYDYPPNVRENLSDLGRTIAEKVQLLSTATSPAEAQAALTGPGSGKPQPKTFSHAIARAALASSSTLKASAVVGGGGSSSTGDDDGSNALAAALEKYAVASEKIGEERLAQDGQIQSRYLAGWTTTLNTQLMFAARARKNVENARLLLDAAKARAAAKQARRASGSGAGAGSGAGSGGTAGGDDVRAEVEQAEDEFVSLTEEAVGVMKNVLDTPEPLRNLAELIAAQLEYHKKAYEILSALAPEVDRLQVEQEASYRKSRDGA
ncbi:MAG: hypothetical protein M1826_004495 [Phylliscum demangeonii]|nr:MAG: hypothetical protein M1826_004495 [Phylliscum demangeonii]